MGARKQKSFATPKPGNCIAQSFMKNWATCCTGRTAKARPSRPTAKPTRNPPTHIATFGWPQNWRRLMSRTRNQRRHWLFTRDLPTPISHTTTWSSSTSGRTNWRWRWAMKPKRKTCRRESISCSQPASRKRSDNPARLCYQGMHGSGRGQTLITSELFIVIAIVCCIPLWVIAVYNHWVTLRNLVDNAWGQTEVQLRRRYDLIPNLVETVKGYATHERETFEKVLAEGQHA